MSTKKSNLNNGQLISNTLPETSVKTNPHGFSTFYPINNQRKSDLYNIQSGWIKRKSNYNKLFSSKTTWQIRWMELRNNTIIYFESNESKTPLQIYQLSHANLPIVLPLDTFKVNDKTETLYPFQLSIVENKDPKSSKEAEILAADSEENRIFWIQCIKYSLFSHLGGAIFGQILHLTLEFERQKKPDREIPEIVETCIIFIRSYGLKNEGLFRLTGRNSKLKLLEEMYDKGQRPILRPINVPNSIPMQTNNYDEKLDEFDKVSSAKKCCIDEKMSDNEVEGEWQRKTRIGSASSESYSGVSLDNKNLYKNRIYSISSESQNDEKTLENNLNNYPDDLITSGLDILNEKLDGNKKIQELESTPVTKINKSNVTQNKHLSVKKIKNISTGLRLSKSMDITRGSKKIQFLKKIKLTDSNDHIDNANNFIESNEHEQLMRSVDDEIVLVDVQTVASLLKSYLRQLPEPLIPHKSYEVVMTLVTREMNIKRESAMLKLKDVLKQCLPTDNYNLIKHLCCFLHEVSINEDFNRMSTENLAKIFCHSIISPELKDPDLLMLTSENRSTVTQVLINNYEFIFNDCRFSNEYNSITKTMVCEKSFNHDSDLSFNHDFRFSKLDFDHLGINQFSYKLDLDFNNYSIKDNVNLSNKDSQIYRDINFNGFNEKHLDLGYDNELMIKCRLNSTSSEGSNKFDIVHDSLKNDTYVMNRRKSKSSIDIQCMDVDQFAMNDFNKCCHEDSKLVNPPSNKKLTPNQLKFEFLRGVDSYKKNNFLDCSLMYKDTLPNESKYYRSIQGGQLSRDNTSRYKYNKPKNNLVVYTKKKKVPTATLR